MKKIVVPVDFSACSINAMRYASNLAHLTGAKLDIVYIHKPGALVRPMPVGEPYFETILSDSVLHQKMKMLKEENEKNNVRTHYTIKEGTLTEAILEVVKDKSADLVVMGTNGIMHTYDVLYGTNTSSLIGKKKVPVLVIPESFKAPISFRNPFVLATDFKGVEFIPLFYIELIKKLKVDLEVFHVEDFSKGIYVSESELEKMEKVEEIFEGVNIFFNSASEKNIVKAITEFAANNHAQMITMISHERSFFEEVMHESTTESMAMYAEIPFLAIPDKKPAMSEMLFL